MKIKLIKGKSYSNGKVKADVKNPIIDVADAEAKKAIASGYFKEVKDEAKNGSKKA